MRRWLAAVAVVGMTTLLSPQAFAQAALVQAAGDNASYRSLAENIVSICPRLGVRQNTTTTSADERDLSQRCTAAVVAANSGNLSAANGTLGEISPEEILAQGAVIDGAARMQSEGVGARIAALTGATPGGRQYAALTLAETASDAYTGSTDSVSGAGQWELWLTANHGRTDKDATVLEDGFEVGGVGYVIGLDYGLTDALSVGGAFGFAMTDLDIDNAGGSMDSDAYSFSLYGTYGSGAGLFASALASYTDVTYDSRRNIRFTEVASAPSATTVDREASASVDGKQYEVDLQAGYGVAFGALNVAPSIGVTYRELKIDDFAETGAGGLDLAFAEQETDSLILTAAADLSYAISTGAGIVLPYVRGAYEYEALDNRRDVRVNYRVDPFVAEGTSPVIRIQTDSPDRSRFLVSGGVSATLANGLQAFADYAATLELEDIDARVISVGVRQQF